jgi:hypothetical protein
MLLFLVRKFSCYSVRATRTSLFFVSVSYKWKRQANRDKFKFSPDLFVTLPSLFPSFSIISFAPPSCPRVFVFSCDSPYFVVYLKKYTWKIKRTSLTLQYNQSYMKTINVLVSWNLVFQKDALKRGWRETAPKTTFRRNNQWLFLRKLWIDYA